MPNWCNNHMTVIGPKEDVDAFVEKARGAGPKYALSAFEKRLRAENSEQADAVFGELAVREQIDELDFNQFVPVPQDILNAGFDNDNRPWPKSGPPVDGYSWQSEYWGTKWNAADIAVTRVSPTEVEYEFDTAWSCPRPVIAAMAAQFPTLTIALSYGEEFPSRGRICYVRGDQGKTNIDIHESANDVSPPTALNDETEGEDGYTDRGRWWSTWQQYFLDDHATWLDRSAIRKIATPK